jgi:hypothetical protein
MQHLCETLLSENYDDANKMNAMKTCLARSDPIIKQDIWTCERIGISDPGVVLLGSSNDTKVLYLFRASEVGVEREQSCSQREQSCEHRGWCASAQPPS